MMPPADISILFFTSSPAPQLQQTSPGVRTFHHIAFAWLAIVIAVVVTSQKWVEFFIGCVVPMTFLYHVSAMCQFVTEHFWARQRQAGQTGKDHYLSLLLNRHLGDPLPEVGSKGIAWSLRGRP